MSSQSTAYPISASLRFPRLRACGLSRAQDARLGSVRLVPQNPCASAMRAETSVWLRSTSALQLELLLADSDRISSSPLFLIRTPSAQVRSRHRPASGGTANTSCRPGPPHLACGEPFLFIIYPQLVKCNRVQRPRYSVS